MAFLLQFLGSLVAVGLLVALVHWAQIARDAPPLDEAHARAVLADDFPDHAIEAVWAAPDGSRALARAGGDLLSVRRLGDGYVTASERFRPEAWPAPSAVIPDAEGDPGPRSHARDRSPGSRRSAALRPG